MIPLHRKTLRALAELICGNDGPVYRRGYELSRFFSEADLACPEHDGSPRAAWTEARLQEYNCDPDQIAKVIEQLADPREYGEDSALAHEALEKLNQILRFEDLRVTAKGPIAQIQTIAPVIEPTIEELLEQVERLKYVLLDSRASSEQDYYVLNQSYRDLRRKLLAVPRLRSTLPTFLRSCRDLSDLSGYMTSTANNTSTDTYVRQSLEPLLVFLENDLFVPSDLPTTATLTAFTPDHIRETWRKALERRISDPEAAITSARTLLESVCKFILEGQGHSYEESADLPKLYRLTANQLNLAPDQHTEDIFKQILGGCQTIAGGLGALRNRLSDAHGKGRSPVRPSARHATLAVNLAGSMAAFLIETYEAQKNK